MNKYIVEFIGTFFLVLVIVCAVASGSPMAPVAIGSILMVMIYAGGHISGAHYNPAVTIAVWMRGKCDTGDVPMYMVAQILGGALAAFLGSAVFGAAGDGGVALGSTGANSVVQGMMAELLGTFALCWVVLHTATTKSNAGNSHYGLAIGFTVLACAYALGGYGTGGCFNPAVAVGTVVDGLNPVMNMVYVILANFIAAALAAVLFNQVYTSQGADD